MKQRVITGLIIAAVLIPCAVFVHTLVFPILLAVLSAVALYEILTAEGCKNKPMIFLTSALGAAVPVLYHLGVTIPFMPVAAAVTAVYLIWMVPAHEKTTFNDVVTALFCLAAVPNSFTMLLRLRDVYIERGDLFTKSSGMFLFMLPFIAAWGTDIFAQLTGRKLGKRKLCPKISPGKSVEGAIGGVIGGIVLTMILFFAYDLFVFPSHPFKWYHILIAAPVLSVISMFGDLAASIIKRNHGVKDFGNILPGHGGVMDRFDSMLLVIPCTWLLTILFEAIHK